MMIEVSNEFLDFDDVIEIEKQIKLFEDISSTDGDYSYAFDIPKTLNNKRLLGNPMPDNISKPVYQRIPAKILSNTGAKTYDGYIRVERITQVYSCSFFAGNNNWFSRITGLMSDLDLSIYDIDVNEVTIIESWAKTEGLIFPLVDNGGLITRSYYQLKLEDFVAAFYVKTLFTKIFAEAGIKVQGELLEDWRYNNMICAANSKDQSLIDARTSYVEKNQMQVLAANVDLAVTWDNDTVAPFFDGSANNFDLGTGIYTADLKMNVKLDVTLVLRSLEFFTLSILIIRINGVNTIFYGSGVPSTGNEFSISLSRVIKMNPGDTIEVRIVITNPDGDPIFLERGTVKITPIYIYRVIGSASAPNWTQQEFVSNILKIFNVLASYNEGTDTVTLNIFEKIKSRPATDLSEFISETEVDYSEFISDYAQRSMFGYQQIEFEELESYNQGKFFKYGQGVIEINNEHLESDDTILESDFANPIAYVNAVFDMSMEKTNLIELEEGDSFPFSNVGNDGFGDAAFNIGDTEQFLPGDLVRVANSTNVRYNGDWVVKSVDGVHVIFNGLAFDTAASGDLVKLNYIYSSSEDVFLFLNIPNYNRANFSSAPIVFDSGGFYPIELNNVAVAYFDLINTGKQINRDFIYSLSFGGIDDPLHYQVTMLESYFRLFSRVLNDPVKLICTAHLPYHLFVQIDFLSPVTIKTMETTNQYYLNRISGFKESFLPTELELIKLP